MTDTSDTVPATATSAPEESRYWVRSVGRALEVLELLADQVTGDGLSVTEIGTALGLSKSAVFATLFTLESSTMIASAGSGMTRRYRLGPGLVRLGLRAGAQNSLRDVARPHLLELSRVVGATSRLAVFESDQAVVVDQVAPKGTLAADLGMGAREFAHSSALGKAVLSQMSDTEVRALVERRGLRRRTDRTIVEVDALLETLHHARDIGYAVDDEEDAAGVFCIGAAISGVDGRCVGAISITNLKLNQPAWVWQRLGRLVHEHALAISAALGYRGPAGDGPGELPA
ncbi:IclR family transcriptional regulator [Herbiconiux sp.]|jgi:IclR family acetate operon transcriptional repressor|uniref:IclR family transcriptional regulator n=1 Tax=Herbiconiux sp. TaxID=1871186 RepID=UPI0025C00547|nr:IclR family transcriptional regulator [Herbiconiux sp.]